MAEETAVKGEEVPPLVTSATADNPPAQATTTSEEDLHSRGQRRVNLIWEFTQAFVAAAVVTSVLYICIRIIHFALTPQGQTEKSFGLAVTAFTLLSSLASLVIGFYFGRTNHQAVGGVQLGR
jgi:hypothetical protein